MLTYDLSQRGNQTIYEYLFQCIKRDILEGKVEAHEKLPSKRTFAKHQQISLKTVENTYEQLVVEGYLYAEEKRGYFVAPIAKEAMKPNFKKLSPAAAFKALIDRINFFKPRQMVEFLKSLIKTTIVAVIMLINMISLDTI